MSTASTQTRTASTRTRTVDPGITIDQGITVDDILGVFANWDEILRQAMAHQASTKDKLHALRCPNLAQREELVRHLLKGGGADDPIFTAIAQDPAPAVRALLAAHRKTPAAILRAFAQDPAESVRAHLASNPSTPPALLTTLAHDTAVPVVLATAAADALDPLEVNRLARHPLGSVRAVIAQRPDLTADLTQRLAIDHVEEVVGALLQSAAKNSEILRTLIALPDPHLRAKLIEHREGCSVMFAGFFADPERRLRDLARARNQAFTHAPSHLHPSNSTAVRAPGAQVSDADRGHQPLGAAGVYWMLDAECPSPSVFAAATNPEMPAHLRLAILGRHDLPAAVREACLKDPDPVIRTAALTSDPCDHGTSRRTGTGSHAQWAESP
jgi:hypothetical protein